MKKLGIGTTMKVLFTDASNEDVDFSKVMGFLALLCFIGLSIHSYGFRNVLFDPTSWAMGVSVIISATAGVSKLADRSGTVTTVTSGSAKPPLD